jgi:hypothetical protein
MRQEDFEDSKLVIRTVNRRGTDNKMDKRKGQPKEEQTTCNACPSYYPFGIFNLFYYSNINVSANEVVPMVLEVKTNEIF